MTDDAHYFAALRVIARLLARQGIGPHWAHNEQLPPDEAEVVGHARALMGQYDTEPAT